MEKAIKLSVLISGDEDTLETISGDLVAELKSQGVRYIFSREEASLDDFAPKGEPSQGERLHSRRR